MHHLVLILLILLLAACGDTKTNAQDAAPTTKDASAEKDAAPAPKYLPAPGAEDPAVRRGSRGSKGSSDSDGGEPSGTPNPMAYELCLVRLAFERDLLGDEAYQGDACSTVGRFKAEALSGDAAKLCEQERDECLERGLPGFFGEPECYTDTMARCSGTASELAVCLEALADASRARLSDVSCDGAEEKLSVKIQVPSACETIEGCGPFKNGGEIYPYGVTRTSSSSSSSSDGAATGD